VRQTDRNVLVSRDWMAPIARMVVVTCSLSETTLLAIPCRSVPFQVSITLAKVFAVYRARTTSFLESDRREFSYLPKR
jgi:hypothetical protein